MAQQDLTKWTRHQVCCYNEQMVLKLENPLQNMNMFLLYVLQVPHRVTSSPLQYVLHFLIRAQFKLIKLISLRGNRWADPLDLWRTADQLWTSNVASERTDALRRSIGVFNYTSENESGPGGDSVEHAPVRSSTWKHHQSYQMSSH